MCIKKNGNNDQGGAGDGLKSEITSKSNLTLANKSSIIKWSTDDFLLG